MTTKEKLHPGCSPKVVPLRDQEVPLLDQIRWVLAGHEFRDVERIAVTLVLECVTQRTQSKNEAFALLHALVRALCEKLDEDYEAITGNNNGVILKGPWQ